MSSLNTNRCWNDSEITYKVFTQLYKIMPPCLVAIILEDLKETWKRIQTSIKTLNNNNKKRPWTNKQLKSPEVKIFQLQSFPALLKQQAYLD